MKHLENSNFAVILLCILSAFIVLCHAPSC